MKTIHFKNMMARGAFMALTLAGTLLYSCGNEQKAQGSDAEVAEENVPAVTPSDSMNYGLNGREGGSDTINTSATGNPSTKGDTLSVGTPGSTGSSDGTTGGTSGTPNDRSNPHVPDNKQ
jgi:hypothetical protein